MGDELATGVVKPRERDEMTWKRGFNQFGQNGAR